MNNNRFLVGIVIALAVLLGIVGISSISYREGFTDGAMRAPQYVYPQDDAPRAAPAPAPQVYAQPYYGYGRPWGWGGFNPLGFCLNILLIGGILFVVSRLFFRWRFGGRGPWGRGGRGHWGGPERGQWGRGAWGWHDDERKGDNGQRNTDKPNARDGDVI